MQTKIRPCRVNFFLKINKRACTSIRYTRVTKILALITKFCTTFKKPKKCDNHRCLKIIDSDHKKRENSYSLCNMICPHLLLKIFVDLFTSQLLVAQTRTLLSKDFLKILWPSQKTQTLHIFVFRGEFKCTRKSLNYLLSILYLIDKAIHNSGFP